MKPPSATKKTNPIKPTFPQTSSPETHFTLQQSTKLRKANCGSLLIKVVRFCTFSNRFSSFLNHFDTLFHVFQQFQPLFVSQKRTFPSKNPHNTPKTPPIKPNSQSVAETPHLKKQTQFLVAYQRCLLVQTNPIFGMSEMHLT